MRALQSQAYVHLLEVFETCLDGLVDSSLDRLLNDASSNTFDELVEQVVLRVTDGELHGVNIDVDVLDLEDLVTPVAD